MQENRINDGDLAAKGMNWLINKGVEVEELAAKFPYSLPIQALASKKNKAQSPLEYSKYLKISAVITPDRIWLYDFLNTSVLPSKQELNEPVNLEVSINDSKNQTIDPLALDIQEIPEQQEVKLVEEQEIVIPLHELDIRVEKDVYVSGEDVDVLSAALQESNKPKLPLNDTLESTMLIEQMLENEVENKKVAFEARKVETPVEVVEKQVANADVPNIAKTVVAENKILSDSLEKEILKVAIDKTIQQEVEELSEETKNHDIQDFVSNEVSPDSFNYWLNPTKSSIASREEKLKKIDSLIEKFIKSEPRIVPKKAEFYSPANVAKQSVAFDEDLVSEPLAAIFEKQGYFDKAIKAYEKLSLKFPEKRAYFAARIEKIREIIKNIKNTK